MNTDFLASTSGKTGTGTTPFDEIVKKESNEQKRVEKELEAMQKEQQEVELSLSEKEKQADTDFREEAKNELKEYKTSDLSTMLKAAEKDATGGAEKLESGARKKMPKVADSLVKQMTDTHSSLFTHAA